MLKSLKYKGKLFILRSVTRDELRHFESLRPSQQYNRYLGLVVNRQMSVNQFTGNVKELQELITKIKEEISI